MRCLPAVLLALVVAAGVQVEGCMSVGEILVAGNYTTLITALQAADMYAAVSNKNFEGTVLAPIDDAWALALSVLGSSPEALTTTDMTALRDILTTHVLTTPLPTLRAGTFRTLQNATNVSIDANTFEATAVSSTGVPGISLTQFGLPPSTLGDDEPESGCKAYVYPLEGFPLVPPTVVTALIALGK